MPKKKKRKKKRKLKKKVWPFLVISIILVISALSFLILEFSNHMIQKNVFPYAYSKRVISIYNKKKEKVGTIEKNMPLLLSKSDIKNMRRYYQIKETPFYVSYKDVKKVSKIEADTLPEHLVPKDKKINIHENTSLYHNKNKVINIKVPFQLRVAYESDEDYYVYFQNQILSISKDESIKEKELKSTNKEGTHVSVLFYEEVSDTCSHKYCIPVENFKNYMKTLADHGYYTINKETLIKYLKGQIELEEKAIFLTSSVTEPLNDIVKEYNYEIYPVLGEDQVHYLSTNKTNTHDVSLKEINRYQIRRDTTLENVLEMAEGKDGTIDIDYQGISVLNYHFFWDPEQGEKCGEIICLTTQKFREQLDYIRDQHFHTLKMADFKKWMYGEIELPYHSVLITVDDGGTGTGKTNGNKLIPLLEEYKMYATLFLIVSWHNIEDYRSPYLDVQSHTFEMHSYGACGRGELNCAGYEKAKEDLLMSLNVVDNADSFCYPFYYYSNEAIRAVKDAGFKLAFAGGRVKATRYKDKYIVPRYSIVYDLPIEDFKNIVN